MGITSKTCPGKVQFPTPNEGPFKGLMYGVDVTATLSYDASKVPPTGPHAYMTNGGTDGGVGFAAGELNLNPNMDNSGSMGWPLIQFRDGKFAGIDYYYSFDYNSAKYVFRVEQLSWEIVDTTNRQVVASGKISSKLS